MYRLTEPEPEPEPEILYRFIFMTFYLFYLSQILRVAPMLCVSLLRQLMPSLVLRAPLPLDQCRRYLVSSFDLLDGCVPNGPTAASPFIYQRKICYHFLIASPIMFAAEIRRRATLVTTPHKYQSPRTQMPQIISNITPSAPLRSFRPVRSDRMRYK